MKILRLTLRLAAFFVLGVATALSAAERKPNIVLIMADDFGYECGTANGGESYRRTSTTSPPPACASSAAKCSRSARPRARN